MNRPNLESGFTLIEVLLALGLSAVIASAIYGLLWTGVGAWKRVRQRAELYQTARIVFERLETDLQNQIPLYRGAMNDYFKFEGTATHLEFPAAFLTLDPSQPSGQRRTVGTIAYTWKTGAAGQADVLIREWTAYAPAGSPSLPTQGSEAFPADIAGIIFRYPTRQSTPATPLVVWEDHWEPSAKIPEGVRIDLVLKQPETGESLTLRKVATIWHGSPWIKPAS